MDRLTAITLIDNIVKSVSLSRESHVQAWNAIQWISEQLKLCEQLQVEKQASQCCESPPKEE